MHPNEVHASTRPRSESGKSGNATSSRNAIKHGLYAAHDVILDDEEDQYLETLTSVRNQLKPQGILEETFTTEVITATWRLRRCVLVGISLHTHGLTPDELANAQKSLDRARAQAHNILRRSTAELRKLQTEGAIRAELAERGFDIEDFPGLTDSRQLLSTLKIWDKHRAADTVGKSEEPDSLAALMAKADHALGMKTPFGSSFCNPAQSTSRPTARNAACPCGSGEKFKRCCGKDAPPVLNHAA